MDWTTKSVLVTGGASFIGSHVVDRLIAAGARAIRVVDDFSSGDLANLGGRADAPNVEVRRGDLLVPGVAQDAVEGVDVVFHLAAIHGGRGYVDLHQSECAKNFILDANVIRAAHAAGVERFAFASSGCVYPTCLQRDVEEDLRLDEDMAGPPHDADGMYGWTKLMAELTLKALRRDHGFRSTSCRLFTVYGERAVENHAVMAMIARAFVGQDPFEVWGDGRQVRNWTYVGDIADGMLLAAERIEDGTAVNLGTEERTVVIDAVSEVLRYTGHRAEIRLRPDMPVGPVNRVASNRRARELLGWQPRVGFLEGLRRTIDWYFGSKDRPYVRRHLDHLLIERGHPDRAPGPARGPGAGRSREALPS